MWQGLYLKIGYNMMHQNVILYPILRKMSCHIQAKASNGFCSGGRDRIWDLGSGASKFPNSQSHITVGDLQLTYYLHSWLSPTPTNTGTVVSLGSTLKATKHSFNTPNDQAGTRGSCNCQLGAMNSPERREGMSEEIQFQI
jgi:hypothetical protein